MKFQVGDLVRYYQGPERMAIVIMVHTTTTGANVCEVVIVQDSQQPESIGQKRYSNQSYWQKVSALPLDAAIAECEDEYEEIIELHQTYGES